MPAGQSRSDWTGLRPSPAWISRHWISYSAFIYCPQYCHTAILPYCHIAILPYCHWTGWISRHWISYSALIYCTCVSSRHSRNCVTLLKLMTELTFKKKVLEHLFSDIFFKRTLNCHHTLTVRAFDLIPTLRTRPEYQLSADIHSHKAGTKLPHELALYLVWPRFFLKSTTFGYAQPW